MYTNMKSLVLWCALTLMLTVVTVGLVAADRDLRLVNAAERHDKPAVQALLKQGVDVNTSAPDGASALHWAAHWNDLEIADLLLRAGAKVNAANDYGVTPLALACENGSTAMVDKLLNAGANANAAEQTGENVLMTAAASGNPAVVKALLAHGANVNAATKQYSQTALMWAIGEGHPDVVQILVEAGADINATSSAGYSPLLFAAQGGHIEAARLLIAAGVDVNGDWYNYPLLVAINGGHVEFAQFLLDRGADANAETRGNTALHAAVTGSIGTDIQGGRLQDQGPKNKISLVKSLIAHGADVNARAGAVRGRAAVGRSAVDGAADPYTFGVGSRRYSTPFWLAADIADVPLMKVLKEAGADPTIGTEDSSTPLMVAAGLGHTGDTTRADRRDGGWTTVRGLEAVKYLLELGADINATNEAGFTALHGTAFPGATPIAQLLVERGAMINTQEFRGRTAYRIAQGHKGAGMIFQQWPETAAALAKLGANTTLGVDPNIAERENLRDEVAVATAAIAKAVPVTMAIESPAFKNGEAIPQQYTVDGDNISPPLSWRNVPAGAKQLIVTAEDLDAATTLPFVHWVMYKIPATVTSLPEGLPPGFIKEGALAGAIQGLQGFERGGPAYRGPAPPRGAPAHRYLFSVYALDAALDLPPGFNKGLLMEKIKDHFIGRGELIGTYSRPLLTLEQQQ